MTWITAIGYGLWLVQALYGWLRRGSLKRDMDDADRFRVEAEQNLMRATNELIRGNAAHSRQLIDLRLDIKELEYDLQKCSRPGDVKRRLERLLQKAGGQAGDNGSKLPN